MSNPIDRLRRRKDAAKGVEFENLLRDEFYPSFYGGTSTKPHKDLGVDRIVHDRHGRTIYIQVKCKAPGEPVDYSEMTNFTAQADALGGYDELVLINTSEKITANAQAHLDAHSVTIIDYPDLAVFTGWGKGKPVSLPKPLTMRPHQQEMFDAIDSAWAEERSTIISATGTGKSLVQHEVIKRSGLSVLLVPSIALVSQHYAGFRIQDPHRPVLALVSDFNGETVYGVQRTTSAAYAQAWVTDHPDGLVISTYQSGDVLVDALDGVVVDTLLYDEAHRTATALASAKRSLFAMTLDDTVVKAQRRLFFTATPRIHSDAIKTRAADEGWSMSSMDEVDVFGKTIYSLSVHKAVDLGLLSPFEINVMLVTDDDVKKWLADDGWTTDISGSADTYHKVGDAASAIGTLRAVQEHNLHSVLTFHRFTGAAGSAGASRDTGAYPAAKILNKANAEAFGMDLLADAIHGGSDRSTRLAAIEFLKGSLFVDTAILCNAKLFTEGVDVPNLDSVVFFDAKSSPIDIAQATGRALRLDPADPSKVAHIVVPLFIGDKRDLRDVVDEDVMGQVVTLVTLLKEYDFIPSHMDVTVRDPAKRKKASRRAPVTWSAPVDVKIDLDAIRDGLDVVFATGMWSRFEAYQKLADAKDKAGMRDWRMTTMKNTFAEAMSRKWDLTKVEDILVDSLRDRFGL